MLAYLFPRDADFFKSLAEEAANSRIWAGIHFRNSCNVGEQQGIALSDYLLANFMRPLADDEEDAQGAQF